MKIGYCSPNARDLAESKNSSAHGFQKQLEVTIKLITTISVFIFHLCLSVSFSFFSFFKLAASISPEYKVEA